MAARPAEGSQWRVTSESAVGHIEPGELVFVRDRDFQGNVVVEIAEPDEHGIGRAVSVDPAQFARLFTAEA